MVFLKVIPVRRNAEVAPFLSFFKDLLETMFRLVLSNLHCSTNHWLRWWKMAPKCLFNLGKSKKSQRAKS